MKGWVYGGGTIYCIYIYIYICIWNSHPHPATGGGDGTLDLPMDISPPIPQVGAGEAALLLDLSTHTLWGGDRQGCIIYVWLYTWYSICVFIAKIKKLFCDQQTANHIASSCMAKHITASSIEQVRAARISKVAPSWFHERWVNDWSSNTKHE